MAPSGIRATPATGPSGAGVLVSRLLHRVTLTHDMMLASVHRQRCQRLLRCILPGQIDLPGRYFCHQKGLGGLLASRVQGRIDVGVGRFLLTGLLVGLSRVKFLRTRYCRSVLFYEPPLSASLATLLDVFHFLCPTGSDHQGDSLKFV
jgi:hypothetical protein